MRKLHLLTGLLFVGAAVALMSHRADPGAAPAPGQRISRPPRPAAPRSSSTQAPREARGPASFPDPVLAGQTGENRHDYFGPYPAGAEPVFLTLPDGSVGRISSCNAEKPAP